MYWLPLQAYKDVFMPAQQIENSPDAVKNHLPSQAAEIFRAAFNNAEQEYGEDISRN